MRKYIVVIAILAAVSARAEQKNVQLLTNLSDWQLGAVMDNFTASLGVHCDFCHVRNEQTKTWDFPSDAKQEKKTAREMIRLVLDVNEKNFHGHTVVGCYTCHLGKESPALAVALPVPPIPLGSFASTGRTMIVAPFLAAGASGRPIACSTVPRLLRLSARSGWPAG